MEVFAARTPTRPRAEQKSLPIAETVIAFSRRGHPKRAPWFGGDLTVDVVDDERIARLTTRYRVSRPAKHAAGRRFSVPCWRASRRQALPRTEASGGGRAARNAMQRRGVGRLTADGARDEPPSAVAPAQPERTIPAGSWRIGDERRAGQRDPQALTE